MNTKTSHRKYSRARGAYGALLTCALLATCCSSTLALTLYYDNFQSYPLQDPAPNPLTNGPASGQWFFVDPVGPTTVLEHRIWDSTTLGSGLNSRVWASITNNARLTNAISLSKLPVAPSHTLRLSFVVATDTLTASRPTTFGYEFRTTGGVLTFVSGGNVDGSQVLTSLSGTALASSQTKGKSDDRKFQFVINATGLTSSDQFVFDITRITNNFAGLTFLLDDVELLVDETTHAPEVLSVSPVYSLQHARITFSEPLDQASATNVTNYTIPGLAVVNAWLIDTRQVEIQTAEQTPGALYNLSINGVLGANGVAVASTSMGFTVPNMAISPVRYAAGTPPGVAPDPTSAGLDWAGGVNANSGMTKAAVNDDLGLNAWQITDNNSLSSGGTITYTTPVDPVSDGVARSNGWRMLMRARYTTNFASAAACHVLLYGDPVLGVRYGFLLGINANGLFATLLGGGTYQLTDLDSATNAYHTHLIAYDPAKATVSYYFDGRLIVPDFGAQVIANINGVQFGSGSSTAKGEVNYNLVQFDVVNGTQPVVVRPPMSSTNGVGQKVTFTASITPFVNSYQWLSNDVPIAGATATNYTTGFISLVSNGDQYKLRAFSAFGNVDTLPATLSVTDDTNPPVVVSVNASPMLDRIRITFSEPVLEAYATDPANYIWSLPGFSTIAVVMVDPLTVELRGVPMTSGSNYTMQVSNIRDTSNLVISNNSPVSFRTPALTPLARYYAGTPEDAPAGPPDPASSAGGNWIHLLTADANLTTNAIVNDMGSGFNAWEVKDATTLNGGFNNYYLPLSAAEHAAARQFGWLLTVRARLVAGNSSGTSAIFAQYEDDLYFRNILNFAFDPAADLRVGLGITNAFENFVLTSGGMGLFEYHLHQIAYDPATKTASYYFDGTLVKGNWPQTYIGTNSTPAPLWGAAGSAPVGTANFNLFELSVVEGPTASVSINNSNVEVAYRGVLQATAQLNPPVWTAVATNANSAPAIYIVPQGAPQQQFFRATSLQ